jgi:Fe-S cluster assembly protein SufD
MAQGVAPETAFLDAYAARRTAPPAAPSWLASLRDAGIERFQEAGFPRPGEEAWRFTKLRSLETAVFRSLAGEGNGAPPDAAVPGSLEAAGPRLVFVNGRFDPIRSTPVAVPDLHPPRPPFGLCLGSLRSALVGDASFIEPVLGKVLGLGRHRFGALNTALFDDGALVWIPAGMQIAEPIHLRFEAAPSEARVLHPRVLIVAGEGTQAVILEDYAGTADTAYFTNAVTEIAVGPNASVTHIKLEREGARAFHIGVTAAAVERDGRLASHAVSVGGKLVRCDLDAVLRGEGAACRLDGLYLARDRQHVDHHTRVDHVAPHTASRELYKGVLGDRATGVFNGRVVIHPQAQKVEAAQTNNNLLLSEEALVNTNPELEIFADDVKAQHGATVGQLDPDHVFYLRSRGLGEDEARRILIHAFAGEMIEKLPHEALRGMLSALLRERF